MLTQNRLLRPTLGHSFESHHMFSHLFRTRTSMPFLFFFLTSLKLICFLALIYLLRNSHTLFLSYAFLESFSLSYIRPNCNPIRIYTHIEYRKKNKPRKLILKNNNYLFTNTQKVIQNKIKFNTLK